MDDRTGDAVSGTGNFGQSGKGDELERGFPRFAVDDLHRPETYFHGLFLKEQEVLQFGEAHGQSETAAGWRIDRQPRTGWRVFPVISAFAVADAAVRGDEVVRLTFIE